MFKKTIDFVSVTLPLFSLMAITIGCSEDDDITTTGDDLVINNYVQIATGQATLYDGDGNVLSSVSEGEDFYGQDANYLKGASMSYTDNGDGTITDDNTGLMWQQTPSSGSYYWQEAVDYCDSLELSGYDDWRIPSLKELFSISNFEKGWPYLNVDYFDLATGTITKQEQFWSSNFYYVGMIEENESAFGVNHVTGHIKAYPAAVGHGRYVRAVRGDAYGTNNFTDNGDGTITDESTGLMWIQDDNGEGVDWENALAYAENSDFAGYDDWRLPNVKELQGIVDYSGNFPAINSLFSCTPITNEAGDADYGYYWTGSSALFRSGGSYYYGWYVAFGRAVGTDGQDSHGAGAVRFDTKYEGGPDGEDAGRYYNYVRIVRDAN